MVDNRNNKRFGGIMSVDYALVPQTVEGYYELEDAVASKISRLGPRLTILELGAGTGITTRRIVESNWNCVVRAVDSEPSMVAQAERNLEREIVTGAVKIELTDALTHLVELPTASVDVVASAFCLHNCRFDYRVEVVSEIFRVLRPGGLVVNGDKYAPDDRAYYKRELDKQLARYEVLRLQGRKDLWRSWIAHELEDQDPHRIMWTAEAIACMRSARFIVEGLTDRIGQYAVLTARKPDLASPWNNRRELRGRPATLQQPIPDARLGSAIKRGPCRSKRTGATKLWCARSPTPD